MLVLFACGVCCSYIPFSILYFFSYLACFIWGMPAHGPELSFSCLFGWEMAARWRSGCVFEYIFQLFIYNDHAFHGGLDFQLSNSIYI